MKKVKCIIFCIKATLLVVFTVFPLLIYSQNTPFLTGEITDGNIVIEYANVVFLTKDSVMTKGTISSCDGEFILDDLKKGDAILQISFLGYVTKYINVSIKESQNNIGTIILEPDMLNLNEITILGSEPVFSMHGNRLVTNVSTTTLKSLGTATDIIERIPGIQMIDEEVTVFNKGTPTIYINNRKILDHSELEQLQSSEISTIELLNNPGAKYDAKGRAVLIIKTKRKNFNGFSFITQEKLRQGLYLSNTENINISYTHDNLNVFATYYHTRKKTKNDECAIYKLEKDTLWEQIIDLPYILNYHIHKVTSGIDWTFAPKQSIGLQYRGYFDKTYYNTVGNIEVLANQMSFDKISSKSFKNEKTYQHVLNAFYNTELSDKFNAQLDFDFLKNHTESNQIEEEKSQLENERIVKLDGLSNFELYAGKLVGNYKITDAFGIEFGGEYNKIFGSGYLLNPEKYIENSIYTNKEVKKACFTSIRKSGNKWNINFGIRYEQSHEIQTEDKSRNIVIDRKYYNFYPSLSLSKKWDVIQMSLTTNKRTQRPSFSQLNSNNIYVNRFLTQKGNSFLSKEDIYDSNLQLVYKKLSFNLGYTYIKNPINISFEDGIQSSASTITFINYPKYQNINMLATISPKIKLWQPQLSLEVLQPFFSIKTDKKKQNYNKINFSIKFYNEFVLSNNYILSLNYYYQNEHDSYMTRWGGFNRIDVGVRKSFFNSKLDVSLQMRDVFNWVDENTIIPIGIYYFEMNKKRETQYATLSLRYRFNNYKRKYRGKNAAPNDINRL